MYIRRPLCVFALLFTMILTILLYISGEEQRLLGTGCKYDGRRICFEGTVKSIEEKNNRSVLQLSNISISDSDILLYLSDHQKINDKLHIGSYIKAEGLFDRFETAHNKGQFDSRKYNALKGIGHVVYDGRIIGVSDSYSRIGEGLRRLRENTEDVYEHYFDRKEYGVIKALILADRGSLDPDIREKYRNAGISHILALSGLHIVTLGLILFGFLRKLRLPAIIAALGSGTAVFSYCLMTGMPVSALRALIMYIISLAAVLTGRTYDMRTASAAAILLMLMINPDHVYDAAFLLSFASIVGIGVVYPGIRELIMHLFNKARIYDLHRSSVRPVRFGMNLFKTIVFSFSLQLSVLPFTMWFFYQIPSYGILVNLVSVPLAGVLLMSGIITGTAGSAVLWLSAVYPKADLVIMPAVYLTKCILRLYEAITKLANDAPGCILITGRPKVWQILVYYAVLFASAAGGHMLNAKDKRFRHMLKKGQCEVCAAVRVRTLRRFSAVFLAAGAAGIILLFADLSPEFELSALDVGQGQCFVMHGRMVPTVIYDCGSTDEKNVGEYRLIPYLKYNGISTVDSVFVSHLDADHVNGVIELLDDHDSGIDIGRIFIPSSGTQRSSDNYTGLIRAATERGTRIYTVSKGDSLKWKHLSAQCMGPDERASDHESDINEDSLVLSVGYLPDDSEDRMNGRIFRALFTGDISMETEEGLLDRYNADSLKHDYLQVAHHGSRGSTCSQFIETVSPSVAVISAGRNNRYGHPHKETLERLSMSETDHTYITSRDGETDCVVNGSGVSIFLFK